MTAETASARPLTSRPRRSARPARTPAWWRDLAGSLAWASMLVVVALWVAGGGVQGLAGEPLTSLGRVTGMVSADLLLLQVFLMARVPFVERSYGQDELAHRHRWVGFASFDLMLAHIVLIVLGYAATDGTGVVATTVSMVLTYPGMLLATAGTALLVMVVVTSLRAARRRLRYESWHLLHLYAYLGAGLALPHQLWTGADFAAPAAQVFWWSAYAVSAGSVLAFRVALPLWRSRRHALTVTAVVREADGVVSVHLAGRKLYRLKLRAGQFLTWRFRSGPGWTRAHPYSLSAPPSGNRVRVTVKDLGDASGALADVRPGTKVLFEGPYGRLTSDVRTRRRVTLIGAGIGVTPLRALLEELDYRPGEVTLLYRARSAADVLFREELDALAAGRGARIFYLLGPRLAGRERTWLPAAAAKVGESEALLHLVPDVAEHDVYLCGGKHWMDAARAAALDAGVPAARIHTERFSW